MSKEELLEVIVAASLRVTAFTYALLAFHRLVDFCHYLREHKGATNSDYTSNLYITDISYYTLLALVMFVLTAPLSRLLCRGLSKVLNPPIPPSL